MKKRFPLAAGILFILAASVALYYFLVVYPKIQMNKITNYDQCAAAGYPIQESYPSKCVLPNGKSFTQVVNNNAGLANPASTNCEEKGGTLEMRADPSGGGQDGYCKFSDGSECEEWAFYRGECKKGDSL